eukprot:TRINITY_DN30598_c0_g1_i1.p1 TRINITY_DN30598_c0_g1~~TRINITY_DN30598_c0_g1_i1.p1  ORF type:complete len:151 (-),score=10.08 TRINITY_DN30598_c0_g1_i1:54-506(-)
MACATQNQKNSRRRCHSRNHHQQDLILDFLSSLDKNKKTSQWQSQVSQINEDWFNMMQVNNEDIDQTSLKANPSKKCVTWSENLLDIKTISPRQFKINKVNLSRKPKLTLQSISRCSIQKNCLFLIGSICLDKITSPSRFVTCTLINNRK